MANILLKYAQVFSQAKPYSLYILLMLLLTYMLNQLDRYTLSITSIDIAQALKFGDKACMPMPYKNRTRADPKFCSTVNETICDEIVFNGTDVHACKYDYNGQGEAYQILAGPAFILIFTFTGIIISIFADNFQSRRVLILVVCLTWWSTMTLLTGFVNSYWQLVLLRIGLGLGEAGCNPMATSIIAEYFNTELKGSALGIYNWGIYTGYSLSFAIGNQILKYLNWEWVFIISGLPGYLLSLLIILTIRQPKPAVEQLIADQQQQQQPPSTSINNPAQPSQQSNFAKFGQSLREFLKPSLFLLCLAGSIRNGAGYVWAYNNNSYYKFLNRSSDEISSYMGVIPIVAGIIGSFVGGFVSDRVASTAQPWKRIWVLVISQLVAAPFVFSVLFFDPPWSYYFLIPTYIFGEMWVGVCLTVIIELVPASLRTTGIGVYFFIITNIGGNIQILVPMVQRSLKSALNLTDIEAFRGALYIFYPGEYVLGSLLFLLTLFVLKRDLNKLKLQSASSSSDQQPPPHSSFNPAMSDDLTNSKVNLLEQNDDDEDEEDE